MARVDGRRTLDAPAELVWAVMTDPAVYERVAPNLRTVELLDEPGEGMVRRCADTDGNAWTERCTRWDPGRAFAVAVDVTNSDFHRRLFSRFEGTWWLEEADDVVQVGMAFEYDTRYGLLGWPVSAYLRYRAGPLMDAIFDGWAAEIDARRQASENG